MDNPYSQHVVYPFPLPRTSYLSKSFIEWACRKGTGEFWEVGSQVLADLFGEPVDAGAAASRVSSRGASPTNVPDGTAAVDAHRPPSASVDSVVDHVLFDNPWGLTTHHVLVIVLVISLLLNLLLWRRVRLLSLASANASNLPLPQASMGDLEAIRDTTSALIERLRRQ